MGKKLSTLIKNNSSLKKTITNSLKSRNVVSEVGGKIKSCALNIPINPVDNNYQEITWLNDAYVKGGYHVVKTIEERDAIDCCYRKQGMLVVVVGEDLSYKEYRLLSDDCENDEWFEITIDVVIDESEVVLIQDYTEIGEDITNQMLLNLAFKDLILQLGVEISGLEIPTNTSDLTNDGQNGSDPFITLSEIPAQTPQVKSDWNAVSGPEEILNKPTIPVIVPQEQSDWNAVSGVSFIKNKPTIPAPVDISGKLDKPYGTNVQFIKGDGTLDSVTYITETSLQQRLFNKVIALPGDVGDGGFTGLYDRNQLSLADKEHSVNLTFLGAGTMVGSLDKFKETLFNSKGDFAYINNCDNTTQLVVEIIFSGFLPNYSKAKWQPFVQARNSRYFKNVKVEVTNNGTTWVTPTGLDITNMPVVKDSSYLWLPEELLMGGITNIKGVRFTLSNPSLNGPVYISNLGFRHLSHTFAPQFFDRSANNAIYGRNVFYKSPVVPTLEMEVTTANSVPNKIWSDGEDLWFTNSYGVNKKLSS